ncbi:MAG: hypothetical protein J6Y94_05060 [Bacteriovoracaceae bacterium]|nr:hypothetical protein [Bacteriovoracaceae bacterium]
MRFVLKMQDFLALRHPITLDSRVNHFPIFLHADLALSGPSWAFSLRLIPAENTKLN